ncbi:hypothetical protein T10_8190 [Trichinella papuae]|uniref:Uncharacterized protein n=1 Tax=Trichinella papuae TaxID=268474 RepID=A0A0V1MI78_9BILA|nr:hypothetical protein T10_8190 [Trichinella papuae]
MFLFSALLIAEAVNKNSIMETTYRTVYTAFLENQYGTKWNFGVFDHIVDHIQQSNKCCGLRKSLNKSQITHPSYYTTLFWLESTNWGQIQQMKIGYDDMNHVPYVPVPVLTVVLRASFVRLTNCVFTGSLIPDVADASAPT